MIIKLKNFEPTQNFIKTLLWYGIPFNFYLCAAPAHDASSSYWNCIRIVNQHDHELKLKELVGRHLSRQAAIPNPTVVIQD